MSNRAGAFVSNLTGEMAYPSFRPAPLPPNPPIALSGELVAKLVDANKKLAALDYISLMSFPGRHGSVVYLKNYLSTMFEISDVMVDKEEVAMTLNIRLELPDESGSSQNTPIIEHEIIVSNELNSVSKSHIEIIIQKMAQILMAQGISCFGCPLSRYKLYPLSGDCREDLLPRVREQSTLCFGLSILCGNRQVATFELTLSPVAEN